MQVQFWSSAIELRPVESYVRADRELLKIFGQKLVEAVLVILAYHRARGCIFWTLTLEACSVRVSFRAAKP